MSSLHSLFRRPRRWVGLAALLAASLVLCGNGPIEAPPTFLLKWGSVGRDPGQFEIPHGLAVGDDGLLYVADTYNSRIQVFTRDGVFVRAWGGLDHPKGIAVAKGGSVYVANTFNHSVKVFTRSGGLLGTWGGAAGSAPGQFYYPSGIALDDSGYVYVADTDNHRIQKLTASGVFVKMWSASGAADLSFVLGLATSGGYLYAVNGSVALVDKYTTTGELVSTFGAYPFLDSPNYVATDAVGNVYVTDGDHHRVVKFSPDGKELTHWGPGGSDDCQFLSPSGIAVDADGNIYVANPSDQYGTFSTPACIQKFGSTSSPVLPRTWGAVKVRYR